MVIRHASKDRKVKVNMFVCTESYAHAYRPHRGERVSSCRRGGRRGVARARDRRTRVDGDNRCDRTRMR